MRFVITASRARGRGPIGKQWKASFTKAQKMVRLRKATSPLTLAPYSAAEANVLASRCRYRGRCKWPSKGSEYRLHRVGSMSHARQKALISSGRPSETRDIVVPLWNAAADQDIVFLEVLDYFLRWVVDVQHHEISVGIDRHQSSPHSVVEKFLAVILIPFHRVLHPSISSRAAMAAWIATSLMLPVIACERIFWAIAGWAIAYPKRRPARP